MKALIGPIKGFNRYEKRLQSVTDSEEFLRKSKKLVPISRHVAQTLINKGGRAWEKGTSF